MAFSFTRAAYLDKQLEDISIVLENALVEARFWLPYRQEVEIRRSGTWLDFPARGIIRGRWEIGHYVINVKLPERTFIGPEIVELPARAAGGLPVQGGHPRLAPRGGARRDRRRRAAGAGGGARAGRRGRARAALAAAPSSCRGSPTSRA